MQFCHILGFLEPEYAKFAVRMGILSKRWKNMWACAPNVNLNSRDFSSSADFIEFVDRLLLFRGSSTIQKFYLYFCRCSPQYFSRVDDWIRIAIRCNVVDLDLCVYDDGYESEVFQLPESLFTCKTLIALKLMSDFVINMPTSLCFPSLKFLYITVLTNNDSMDFSPFPALEHLVIDEYFAYDGFHVNVSLSELKTLQITCKDICRVINMPTSLCFPSLKFLYITVLTNNDSMDFSPFPALEHLVIDEYFAYDGFHVNVSLSELKTLQITCKDICRVYINCPKLEKLDLKGLDLSEYIFENTKSLVKANAYVYHESEEGDEEETVNEEDAAACANNLLQGISGVRYLFLSSHISEDCSVPAFDNLSKLTLALDSGCLHTGCYGWDILTTFLERSSNLEYLELEHESHLVVALADPIKLERYIEKFSPEGVAWRPPKCVPKCVSSHLKSVTLKGFQGKHFFGHLDQMEVLKYLLKNGEVLKEMKIYTEFLEQELHNELSRFEWGSETCQLKIICRGLFKWSSSMV